MENNILLKPIHTLDKTGDDTDLYFVASQEKGNNKKAVRYPASKFAKKEEVETQMAEKANVASVSKVQDEVNQLSESVIQLEDEVVRNKDIVSVLGSSTAKIPNEKAVTDALNSTKEELRESLEVKYYPTENELKIAQPNPKKGSMAWAGDPYPGTVWVCNKNGVWTNTGKAPESAQVNLAEYLKTKDAIQQRYWLLNKGYDYNGAEIGAISRIFSITIYDSSAKPSDSYTINEFYEVDGLGVLNILKNGVTFTRQSNIDITKQQFTTDKVNIHFDLLLPVAWNLNTNNSNVVLSPSCITIPPLVSKEDRYLFRTKKWLKNKDVEYLMAEQSAIKRIIDLKIYVSEKNDADVYTINIMRTYSPEGTTIGQLSVYKNGSSYYAVQLDLSKQYYLKNGQMELWYDFTLGTTDKNSVTSEIMLSDSAILLFADYYKTIGYEILDRYTDEYGNVTSATVRWGDGSSGIFTATDFNSTFLCFDGYTVQHADTYKTLQQPRVSRNGIGVITNKPKLFVY